MLKKVCISTHIGIVFLLIALFLSYSPASAQVVFSSNEGQFRQENPSLQLQTFERGKVGISETEACNTPVNMNSNDDCFSPGDILPGLEFTTDPVSGDTILAGPFIFNNENPVKVLTPDGSMQDSVILFPDDEVMVVGLTLGCLFDSIFDNCTGETYFVDVYGQGNALLGSTTVEVSGFFNTFVGITSSEPIEKIQFGDTDSSVPSFNGVSEVLIAKTTAIPTLSKWGMIAAVAGLGIAGLMAIRRRMGTGRSGAIGGS